MSFRLRVYDSLGKQAEDIVNQDIKFTLKEDEPEPAPSPAAG